MNHNCYGTTALGLHFQYPSKIRPSGITAESSCKLVTLKILQFIQQRP